MPKLFIKSPFGNAGSQHYLRDFVQRVLLFACIWMILSQGIAASWWFGAPVVIVVAFLSLEFVTPVSPRWLGILLFIPYFVIRSFLGAVDVSWRALQPTLRIDPVLVNYPMRLQTEISRVFMINTVSLLPGTLSIALDDNNLKVHVLVDRKNILSELETLERKVAAVFGAKV